MNFAAFDLNLLRVFNAMMIERSTVRAGERVGLSQPAVSSALGRLRQILQGDLFVRDGNRMVPTAKALALQDSIRSALQQIADALTSMLGFEPATADHDFVIAGSDYISTFLMPQLARTAASEAPRVTLQMLDFAPAQVFSLLSDGKVDVAVERGMDPPEWVHQETLFRSFVVCIARRNHPVGTCPSSSRATPRDCSISTSTCPLSRRQSSRCECIGTAASSRILLRHG